MINIKRTVSVIILVAMLILSVSCTASNGTNDTEPTDTTTTTPTEITTAPVSEKLFQQIEDDIPKSLNYNNDKIQMLVRGVNERYYKEFFVTEVSADRIDDAIFNRELRVEDRLGVDIEVVLDSSEDAHGPWEGIEKEIRTGDCTYQIIAGSNNHFHTYAIKGQYHNLQNIENIDLKKGYWSQGLIENLTLHDTTFGATGAISTYLYDSTFVMYFNRKLCSNFAISAEDVYGYVNDGEWTLDKMISLTSSIYADDGNNIVDAGDTYGMGIQVTSATDGLWSSCDIDMTSLDSDGNVILQPDIYKITGIVEKMNKYLWENDGVVALAEGASYASDTAGIYLLDKQFIDGNLCFVTDWLYSIRSNMRNMEDPYGILPYPKYNTTQKQYHSYVHDKFTVVGMPMTVNVENEGMVGAVLECMASTGQNLVMPEYFYVALTAKYAQDEASVDMLYLIFDNLRVDRGWAMSGGLGNVGSQLLRNFIWHNTNNVASTFQSIYASFLDRYNITNKGYMDYTDN